MTSDWDGGSIASPESVAPSFSSNDPEQVTLPGDGSVLEVFQFVRRGRNLVDPTGVFGRLPEGSGRGMEGQGRTGKTEAT